MAASLRIFPLSVCFVLFYFVLQAGLIGVDCESCAEGIGGGEGEKERTVRRGSVVQPHLWGSSSGSQDGREKLFPEGAHSLVREAEYPNTVPSTPR